MAKKQSKPTAPAPAKSTTPSKTATAPAPSNQAVWWFGLLAGLLGFLLYANTFGHQYALDDYSCIKDNYIVQGGLKNLGTIFSTEYRYGYKAWGSVGSLYRPATLSMFALEWQLSPDNPVLYHFINALFFGLTGWLLWATWRRILSGYPAALTAVAVLIFMVHPVHTEAVANIKSRDEIMALFSCTVALYSLWRYVERGQASWLLLSVVSYLLGFFFKESSITFLAIFPLCLWFFGNKSIGSVLKISALYLIPAALFLLMRHKVLSTQPGQEVNSILDNFIAGAPNKLGKLASAFMMCGYYLKALVFPQPLVSDQGYPELKPVTFADWRALLGFVIYVGGGVWALMNIGKKHFLAFAILFYLITFSLYSNVLIEIGTSYGERLLYVPSLGFAFGIAWLLCKVFDIKDLGSLWPSSGKTAALWGTVGIVSLLLAVKTFTRNPVWYDSYSLYAADILNSPNAAKLNYHLGLEHIKAGLDEDKGVVKDKSLLEKGVASYTKAIELYPQYHDAYGSRGLAHFRLQNYDKAFEDYQVSLKYRATDAKVLSNLGFIYFMRAQQNQNANKDFEKAEDVYKKAVQYDPRFVDARRNLGAVLAISKRYPEAIENWQKGLEIEPNNPTLLQYIGSAYRDMGQPEKAQSYFQKAEAARAAGNK